MQQHFLLLVLHLIFKGYAFGGALLVASHIFIQPNEHSLWIISWKPATINGTCIRKSPFSSLVWWKVVYLLDCFSHLLLFVFSSNQVFCSQKYIHYKKFLKNLKKLVVESRFWKVRNYQSVRLLAVFIVGFFLGCNVLGYMESVLFPWLFFFVMKKEFWKFPIKYNFFWSLFFSVIFSMENG